MRVGVKGRVSVRIVVGGTSILNPGELLVFIVYGFVRKYVKR